MDASSQCMQVKDEARGTQQVLTIQFQIKIMPNNKNFPDNNAPHLPPYKPFTSGPFSVDEMIVDVFFWGDNFQLRPDKCVVANFACFYFVYLLLYRNKQEAMSREKWSNKASLFRRDATSNGHFQSSDFTFLKVLVSYAAAERTR